MSESCNWKWNYLAAVILMVVAITSLAQSMVLVKEAAAGRSPVGLLATLAVESLIFGSIAVAFSLCQFMNAVKKWMTQ